MRICDPPPTLVKKPCPFEPRALLALAKDESGSWPASYRVIRSWSKDIWNPGLKISGI